MSGSIPEPPGDGHVYGRRPGDWEAVMPLLGGTMRGPLHLWNTTPTYPQEAASKEYVDGLLGTGGAKMASYKYVKKYALTSTAPEVEFDDGPCDAIMFTLPASGVVNLVFIWNDGSRSEPTPGPGGIVAGILYPISCKGISIGPGNQNVSAFYYEMPSQSAKGA